MLESWYVDLVTLSVFHKKYSVNNHLMSRLCNNDGDRYAEALRRSIPHPKVTREGIKFLSMDAKTARDILIQHGVVSTKAELIPLAGGVSCDVWRIDRAAMCPPHADDCPFGLVVKAPLAQLRVPTVWKADVSRGIAETQALGVYASITPTRVPSVVWSQEVEPLLAMEAAPWDWQEWREQLFECPAPDRLVGARRISEICRSLGDTLAQWHTETGDVGNLPEALTTGDRLRTLRTNPFHRATASAVPRWADMLNRLASDLEEVSICLVHGDFSPKNFLVSPTSDTELWILDAEVAHLGNPALDVSYLSAHLILKAIARPELRAHLDDGRRYFEAAYRGVSSLVDPKVWNSQTGAIVAARVFGISRATYLNEEQQREATRVADELLLEGAGLDSVWSSMSAKSLAT